VQATGRDALDQGRWLCRETRDRLLAECPGEVVRSALAAAADQLPDLLTAHELAAVRFLDVDLDRWIADRNEEIAQAEKRRHASFFATVERRPLTDEQTRAVVCFDNRVQVVASAGSGKTSVMVARAAYAVLRGFVPPDRILLLAFNKDAADELKKRVASRLQALGLPSEGLRAETFHAFGLSVIGQATGRKPRLARWLDQDRGVGMLQRIVDELRDRSPSFAYRWDLFRLVYARPDTEDDEDAEPSAHPEDKRYPTARGDVVKSRGEQMIADFLFYNGVDYEYEHPYSVDVADREHSQYRPDFFYPQVEVWHEHWALDAHDRPPPTYVGYADDMRWKKQLHARHGTTLIETTSAQIHSDNGLEQLAQGLVEHGIGLDWNPDRPAPSVRTFEHAELVRLMRSFMTHAKSNALSRADLLARIDERTPAAARYRSHLFVELYLEIAEAWDAQLRAEDSVDFDDMLVRAAEHLEAGRADGGADLVMVDEFQDASQARARVTRALVARPGRFLLAVGDDWQSINRFAGADTAVMTRFVERFGPGPRLYLQTTFRCPQTLCDTAGWFVSRNPGQLRKTVRSAQLEPGPPVRLVRVSREQDQQQALLTELTRIARLVAGGAGHAGGVATGAPRKVTVDVLGRYRHERRHLPEAVFPELEVRFRTVHGSKGLEADYVLIPSVHTGVYGFPSTIQDDPVLDLVMAEPDPFTHAEERRLFYVALTRARRQVTLFSVAGRESPFVRELLDAKRLEVDGVPEPAPAQRCPRCRRGRLVAREGPYGPFYGCSNYRSSPSCRYTRKIAA
jgi:DNA helicase-4